MATAWGQGINTIGWGKIYGESWWGEYIFYKVASDANDFAVRVVNDGGTMEAHACLVDNMDKTLR